MSSNCCGSANSKCQPKQAAPSTDTKMSSCCGSANSKCQPKQEAPSTDTKMSSCCGSANIKCQPKQEAPSTATKMSSCCGSANSKCQPKQETPATCVPTKEKCCSDGTKCHQDDKDTAIHDSVKEYYGKELKAQNDLQTSVKCIRDSNMPCHVKEALAMVHDEVFLKYYGCGPVIPEQVEGCSVLDLGSGSGRDCFALSKLVGPAGRVVGIDMTEEQLAVARKHVDYHTEKFGYTKPNVEFVFGYIEKLSDAGLPDNTFDIIVSNCVINLCPDKRSVLTDAHRVLKDGGEVYFSDVYTDSHLSDEVRKHRVLWGECIAGALQWQELFDIAQKVGFSKPRLVIAKMLDVSQFKDILGDSQFVSATYRLFKLPANEKNEDPAARRVTYKGGILGCTEELKFDHAVTFKKDVPLAVDTELNTILATSRFSEYFTFGDCISDPETAGPKVDPFQLAEPAIPNVNVC